MKETRGSETSQYPEEKKSSEIPQVAASETGRAQTNPTTKKSKVRTQKSELKKDLSSDFLLLHSDFFVVGLGL
jgi:hypothetical protein